MNQFPRTSRYLVCALVALASGVAAQEATLRRGDELFVESRLRMRQGHVGELERGESAASWTRSVLAVHSVRGGEVVGVVTPLAAPVPQGPSADPTEQAAPAPEPLPYRGRPTDLVWLSAPAVLGPLARDLRQGRLGERTVPLEVAGYPIELGLTLSEASDPELEGGRALWVQGEGAALIGDTGITLRVRVRARLELAPSGESSLDLRLSWTATGGDGDDAESQVHLQTRVTKRGAQ
ncbi:MAG: hypothetical protein R3F62_02460 [Planctomycetota bacterium]